MKLGESLLASLIKFKGKNIIRVELRAKLIEEHPRPTGEITEIISDDWMNYIEFSD